jgi:hypothetical protein
LRILGPIKRYNMDLQKAGAPGKNKNENRSTKKRKFVAAMS